MSDLSINTKKLEDLENGVIVEVIGSIDARSVVEFQTKLNQLISQHVSRIIIDMDKVRYVNSTGLGCLITMLDSVGVEGGKIVLMNLQPKVKVVFDMLGLTSFFKIVPSIADAIEYFLTSSEQQIEEEEADTPKETTIVQKKETDLLSQPGTIKCKGCYSSIRVEQTGVFKCPKCFKIFNLISPTEVVFLSGHEIYPLQFTLNYTKESIEGLMTFTKLFAKRIQYDEKRVDKIVKSVLDTVKKNAYKNDENNIFHVEILLHDSQMEMKFIDSGESLDRSQFDAAKSLAYRFDLANHPRKGNIVSIVLKKEDNFETLL